MEKLILVDGNNLMFRAFYALPQLRNFNNEISNGVFGFANMLIKVIVEQKPDYIVVAFDKGKKTFRHQKYKEYKAQRKPTPTELLSQFPILKEMLNLMNIKFLELDDIEADDIIGILSRKFNTENIILSADRDLLQLVNSNTTVMSLKKGITETLEYTPKSLKEILNLEPYQIIELKALMGDASDNIPGVAGVGEKIAQNLIEKYENLDNVYAHIDEISGKLHDKLVEGKDVAYLSKDLATINLEYDIKCELQDFKYDFPFSSDVYKFFKKYQFNSLLKRSELFENIEVLDEIEKVKSNNYKLLTISNESELDILIEKLRNEKEFACLIDANNISVAFGGFEYNISTIQNLLGDGLNFEYVLKKLELLFGDSKIKKVFLDSKKVMHLLNSLGLNGLENYYDVLIARYLINSNAKHNTTEKDLAIENNLKESYLSSNLLELKAIYDKELEKFELINLMNDIELPLVKVLFEMEKNGVEIDLNELNNLKQKYATQIEKLTQSIYESAGEKFNINSPKQLAEILFNKLGLKTGKKKETSTSVDVLNDLIGKHDIIPLILNYRQINKLYTTYIIAFEGLIDKATNKIHTTFNQVLTTTGRLSSSEPNLQNIPVRSEEGKNIRKMFVSSFENGRIVSADYSQIELRLLACFSGDDVLINAFNTGEDIHARTASEIFGVPINQVSPEMRRNAKAINFGIIYGISDYGLSVTIGSSVMSAKKYIQMYFDRYPKIYEYMQKNIDDCRNHGYIKTFKNRMRIVPEINSSNRNLRLFAERVAMNMPLQGGASDIIKMAMIKVYNRMKKAKLKSKLILQVHDELVVDCVSEEVDIVSKILKEEMESVVNFKVKLRADVECGSNWLMD